MTAKDYELTTLERAKQRRWRLLLPVKTASMTIPAGTVVRVTDKRNGWTVATDPCKCCGVTAYARRVPAAYLEVIR